MKKALLAVLLCNFIHEVFSQNSWGKADIKQFTNQYCPFDSSANAMVLFDHCDISFDRGNNYAVIYRQHKRIQILNKEGYSNATVSIPFYMEENTVGIEIRAQTLNAGKNGELLVTKIDKKAIFEEHVGGNHYKKKFSFPDVREGSILEYEFTSQYRAAGRSLRDWYFQTDIPTLESSVSLNTPMFLHYTAVLQSPIALSTSSDENNSDNTFSFYAMKNIPAIKSEKYVTTLKDYTAQIHFILNSANIPGQPLVKFHESWSEVSQELLTSSAFGFVLDGTGEHRRMAKELTKGVNNSLEKTKIIYKHITEKMKWNGVTDFIPDNRLAKKYNEGLGSSADINMMLIDMLRAANVTADPVAISTRTNGKVDRVVPDMGQFNHVIALAETDSGSLLLDATSDFRPYNLLALEDLNNGGLRMGSPYASWVDIKPVKSSASTIAISMRLDSTGKIYAKGNLTTSDYESLPYRSALQSTAPDECLRQNLVLAQETEISNVAVTNQLDNSQRLKISFDLQSTNDAPEASHIYLNPFALKFRDDNPFKLSSRTYPVNFGYPFEENIKISLAIPDNYTVAELPKSLNAKLEDESASFTLLIAKAERNIQINTSLKIKKTEYATDMYENLKSLFSHLIEAYSSVIVLEKK
ncbi:MAG TPA: DUF3857 domain-containing protein [Chitinophagales bacterium]|nr:DUF3857 domain-containing protein [Chitinophagales bacterium]